MKATAIARYVRCGARKVRPYAALIRGKNLREARAALAVQSSPSAKVLSLCLESAVANAENNHGMDADDLKVAVVMVDGAFKMPRLRPRARGRADRYYKFTCHITVSVSDGQDE
jgi:large subunit ribosomal protein L22